MSRPRSGSDMGGRYPPKYIQTPRQIKFDPSSAFEQKGLYMHLYKVVGQSACEQKGANGKYCYLQLEFSTGKSSDAVCDTGCDGFGLISRSLADQLGLEKDLIEVDTLIGTADKHNKVKCKHILKTRVRAGSKLAWLELVVMDSLDCDLLIGARGLEAFDLLFGFKREVEEMNKRL